MSIEDCADLPKVATRNSVRGWWHAFMESPLGIIHPDGPPFPRTGTLMTGSIVTMDNGTNIDVEYDKKFPPRLGEKVIVFTQSNPPK